VENLVNNEVTSIDVAARAPNCVGQAGPGGSPPRFLRGRCGRIAGGDRASPPLLPLLPLVIDIRKYA